MDTKKAQTKPNRRHEWVAALLIVAVVATAALAATANKVIGPFTVTGLLQAAQILTTDGPVFSSQRVYESATVDPDTGEGDGYVNVCAQQTTSARSFLIDPGEGNTNEACAVTPHVSSSSAMRSANAIRVGSAKRSIKIVVDSGADIPVSYCCNQHKHF